MKLGARTVEVAKALAELRSFQRAEEQATALRKNAEVGLAELTGIQRRDKDTGFEAEYEAQRLIIASVLEAVSTDAA